MQPILRILPLLPALLLSQTASAADNYDNDHHIPGVRFDIHANVGGYASVGAGFRAEFPLAKNGMLAEVNDELALSLGMDVFFANLNARYYDGGPYLIPGGVLQWNFYLDNGWSIFPEAGLAVYVGDEDYLRRGRSVYVAPNLGIGVRYHLNGRTSLLARVSTPAGLQLGVSF